MVLEVILKEAVEWVATATEAISTLVIAVGVAQAAAMTAGIAIGWRTPNPSHRDPRERIRLQLGRSLALALEFQLAADILKTAVTPTWDDIGKVAAIILLRTVLNFFLEREIEIAERRQEPAAE